MDYVSLLRVRCCAQKVTGSWHDWLHYRHDWLRCARKNILNGANIPQKGKKGAQQAINGVWQPLFWHEYCTLLVQLRWQRDNVVRFLHLFKFGLVVLQNLFLEGERQLWKLPLVLFYDKFCKNYWRFGGGSDDLSCVACGTNALHLSCLLCQQAPHINMADLLPNQPHIFDVASHNTPRSPLACCER